MKTLIVYYSFTGLNRKFAQALSKELGFDLEELKEENKRSMEGPGAFFCVLDTFLNNSNLMPTKSDPSQYELVILGSPVWAGTLPPAMCKYIGKNKGKFKKTAFFSVNGMSAEKAFAKMEALCGAKPVKTFEIQRKNVSDESEYEKKAKEFAKVLQ